MHGENYCKAYDLIQAILFFIGLAGLLASVVWPYWLIIPVLFWTNCQILYWWCVGVDNAQG